MYFTNICWFAVFTAACWARKQGIYVLLYCNWSQWLTSTLESIKIRYIHIKRCIFKLLEPQRLWKGETVCLISYPHTFVASLFYFISTSLTVIVRVSGVPAPLPAENYLSVKLWGRHWGVFLLPLCVHSQVGAPLCSTTALTAAPKAPKAPNAASSGRSEPKRCSFFFGSNCEMMWAQMRLWEPQLKLHMERFFCIFVCFKRRLCGRGNEGKNLPRWLIPNERLLWRLSLHLPPVLR